MPVYYPRCRVVFKVIFDGFDRPDSLPYVFEAYPRSCSVHMNSYKEADTFEIEFDGMDFPFSPEVIRASGVEIYFYESSDATSVGKFQYNGDPSYTDTKTGKWIPQLMGLVDEAHLHLGTDGRTFRISGRDYTCLMLDKIFISHLPPDPNDKGEDGTIKDRPAHVMHGKLVDVVQQLVSTCATGTQVNGNQISIREGEVQQSDPNKGGRLPMTVEMWEDVEAALESEDIDVALAGKESIRTPKKKSTNSTTKVKQRTRHPQPSTAVATNKSTKSGHAIRNGNNYWDVIYRLCVRQGFIVFVDKLKVIITRPNILDEASARRARRVAYGRNLSTLEIDRRVNRQAVAEVIVSSYDSKHRRTVRGRWSKEKDRPDLNKPSTVLGTQRDERVMLSVPGVTSEDTLTEMAKSYYHSVSKGEAKINFTTRALRDLTNHDMINLRVGDPVYIEWDAFNSEELHKQPTVDARVAYLRSRGYNQAVSEVVAAQYQKLSFVARPFYVRAVSKSWSTDQGLQLQVEAINFISPERDNAT